MALQLDERELLNLYTLLLYKPPLRRERNAHLPALPTLASADKYSMRGKRDDSPNMLVSQSGADFAAISDDYRFRYLQVALGITKEKSSELVHKAMRIGSETICQKELNLYAFFLMRNKGVQVPLDFESDACYNKWKQEEKNKLDELVKLYCLEPFDNLIGTNDAVTPVRVTCAKGQGLKAKGKNGHCDAYCTFHLDGKLVGTSFIVENCVDPTWDFTQVFLLDNSKSHDFSIQIWNKTNYVSDPKKNGVATIWSENDAFLGCYNFKIDKNCHDEEGWYKAEKRSSRSNVSGKMYVSVDIINQNTRASDLYLEAFVCIPGNPRLLFSKIVRVFFEHDSKNYEAIMESDPARKIIRQLRDFWRIDDNTWSICKIIHATDMLISNRVTPLQFNTNIVGTVMSCEASAEFLPVADRLQFIKCRDELMENMKSKLFSYLFEDSITLRTWDDFRISTMMLADIKASVERGRGGSSKAFDYFEEFLREFDPMLKDKINEMHDNAFAKPDMTFNESATDFLSHANALLSGYCEYFSNSKCLSEFGYSLDLEKRIINVTYEVLQKNIVGNLKMTTDNDIKTALDFHSQLHRFYTYVKSVDQYMLMSFTSSLNILTPILEGFCTMVDRKLTNFVKKAISLDDFAPMTDLSPLSSSILDILRSLNDCADRFERIESIDTALTRSVAVNIACIIIATAESYIQKVKSLAVHEAKALPTDTSQKPSTTKLARKGSVFNRQSMRNSTLRVNSSKNGLEKFDASVLRVPRRLCVMMANISGIYKEIAPIYSRVAGQRKPNAINGRLGLPSEGSGIPQVYSSLTLDLTELRNMRPHFPLSSKIKFRILLEDVPFYESKSFTQRQSVLINEPVHVLAKTVESKIINFEVQMIQMTIFQVAKHGDTTSVIRNKEYIVARKTFSVNVESKAEIRSTRHLTFEDDYGELFLSIKPEDPVSSTDLGIDSDLLMKMLKSRVEFNCMKMYPLFVELLCHDFRDSLKSLSRKYKTQAQKLVSMMARLKLKDAFSGDSRDLENIVIGTNSDEGNEVISPEKVEEDIQGVLYRINENFALIVENMEHQTSQTIVKEVWIWMLWICESCLVPDLEDPDKNKDIWESNRVIFMFYAVNYLLEFFYADGEGLPLPTLQNTLFVDLIEIMKYYNLPTKELKDEYKARSKTLAASRNNPALALFSKLQMKVDDVSDGDGILRILRLRNETNFLTEALKLKVGLPSNLAALN